MVQTYPPVAGVKLKGQLDTQSPSADWAAFAKSLPDFTGKRVLVLGCNNGWLNRQAILGGALSSLGVDSSPQHIDFARKQAYSSRLRFRLMPEDTWPLVGGMFDIIVVSGLTHVNERLMSRLPHLFRHAHGRLALFGDAETVKRAESAVFSADHQPGSWRASELVRLPSGAVASVLRRSRLGGHS